MVYDVFISYSRKDSEVADRIFNALSAEGIKCFIDQEGISGGASFPAVLSDAIMNSKLMLFLASENSYKSEFTITEITFAKSNKGSRFIFPLIIDGSTFPKSLEFLLSNINWRTLSLRYRIEKELVAEVKTKLADPHAGETISHQEKKSFKVIATVFFVVVVALLAIILAPRIRELNENRRMEQERKAVEAARNECEAWLTSAQSLIHQADSLRDTHNQMLTFYDECACLEEAALHLQKADSVRMAHRILDVPVADIKKVIDHKQDSMSVEWNTIAMRVYNSYALLPSEETRTISLRYVDMALYLHPEDAQLNDIRSKLSQ